MPILETGKRNDGFTLLEILGVITLLVLVTIIVYPRFELNEEKTEALFIGRLIKADVELLRGEALANREILTLHFSKDSYDYQIGGATVSRSFHRFDFKFAIPEEEKKDATEESAAAEDGQSEDKKPIPEIEFAGDGSCSSLSMPWETSHFAGTLEVTESGEAKWIYAKKAKVTKDSL